MDESHGAVHCRIKFTHPGSIIITISVITADFYNRAAICDNAADLESWISSGSLRVMHSYSLIEDQYITVH